MVERCSWKGKRKFIEEVHVYDVEDVEDFCVKRRPALKLSNIEVPGGGSASKGTKIDFILIDGKWDGDDDDVDLGFEDTDKTCFLIEDVDMKRLAHEEEVVEVVEEADFDSSTDSAIAASSSFSSSCSSSSSTSPTSVVQPPQQQISVSSDTEESSNLSWLLNFNVNSLFSAAGVQQQVQDTFRGSSNSLSTPGMDVCRSSFPDVAAHRKTSSSIKMIHSNGNSGPKKPPFTYTELIEQALREKGELTVSGIYNWISEHFSYYKANDDRWKNSVRHNLSINPHFRKGSKAPHGAGHLWTVATKEPLSPYSLRKQQTMQQYIKDTVTLDETAAATASIEENKENRILPEDILLPQPDEGITLEQSAEEILSGVKKQVQVQYVMPVEDDKAVADFLNPISREVIIQESGLFDKDMDVESSFFVTDLNPGISLELNMADSEVITADTLFPEDLGFQYFELTASSELLV